MNEILHFNANSIFRMDRTDSSFPLDLNFIKDEQTLELHDLGYFYLTYNKELIYIGISEGNEDVIEARFKKQLESISLRSRGISFSQVSWDAIQNCANLVSDFHEIQKPSAKGCETSVNKVIFANKKWEDFRVLHDSNLLNFDFYWVSTPEATVDEVRMIVDQLKKLLKPKCNG